MVGRLGKILLREMVRRVRAGCLAAHVLHFLAGLNISASRNSMPPASLPIQTPS